MYRYTYPASVAVLTGFVLSLPIAAESPKQNVSSCRQAHAHNDYLHERPLLDALDNGFGSVEADIFLVDGELLVAHTRRELAPGKTLRGLYLDPLRDRIKQHRGSVHGDGHPFTLLIDIKSKGEPSYRALHQLLSQYDDIFSSVADGKVTARAVNAVISGNRPVDVVAADSPRYVGIDGRLSDLGSDHPANLMPLISDNWRRHFKWRGSGEMPAEEHEKLVKILQQAHAKDRRVRFWAIPDNVATWTALHAAGVDLINTDDLSGLGNYLRSAQATQPRDNP